MIRAFHQPKALDKALALVAKGATPVAGATALYSGKSERDLELVDITRLKLNKITVDKERIALGAAVTLSQISDDRELPGMAGALLRRGARSLVSRPVRNAVTLGGNIAHACYWADMPVVLLALGASIEVRKADAPPYVVTMSEVVEGRGRPWDGGLITQIFVPREQGTVGFGHERFSRTTNDYALATACAVLRRDNDVAREVTLVFGAIQPRPFIAKMAGEALEGQHIDESLLEALTEKLAPTLSVAPNFRASVDYRKKLSLVLAKRALSTAFTWAKGEN